MIDDDALWGDYCDQCLEPLAICKCGYSWNISEDDDEPIENPCHQGVEFMKIIKLKVVYRESRKPFNALLATLVHHQLADGVTEVKLSFLRDVAVALEILERGGDVNELHPGQWSSLKTHLKHYLLPSSARTDGQ